MTLIFPLPIPSYTALRLCSRRGLLPFTARNSIRLSLLGACSLSFGILWLAANGIRKGGIDRKTLFFALFNGGIIALYSLVDGTGGRLSGHSVSYNIWLEFLDGVLFVPSALYVRRRPLARELITQLKTALLGGGAAFASYGIAIWAVTYAPIGQIAAVRKSSVLFCHPFRGFVSPREI